MTDRIKEQISALVDGELPEPERALLLARLEKDPALAECWKRYHLVSDVLRHQAPAFIDKDLGARVRAAVAQEADLHVPRRFAAAWIKPLAGVAIAASVAAVAVISVRSVPEGPEPPALASAGPESGEYLRVEGMRWKTAKPGVANRLNAYLVNHNEYAGSNGVQGVLPYSRIVGYDTGTE